MVKSDFTDLQKALLPIILIPAFMSLMAVSIINVILPAIGHDLSAGATGLQWAISGYALTFGVMLVPAGRAGDLWGRGRLFVAGLVLYGLGATLSGLAPNIMLLNLARVLMGVGSGIFSPQVTGMIQQYFQGHKRAIAFGLFGGAIGISVAVGPVLGGVLVAVLGEAWGWRASFLVNLPIAIAAVAAAAHYLPESAWRSTDQTSGANRVSGTNQVEPPANSCNHENAANPIGISYLENADRHESLSESESGGFAEIPENGVAAEVKPHSRVDFDPVGMLLLAAGTSVSMAAFMEAGSSIRTWVQFGAGVVALLLWVLWEARYKRRGGSPIVDIDLFRTRSFGLGALLIALTFVGVTSIWLLVAQYMQTGLGHTALASGLIGLPAAIAGGVVSALAGNYVMRFGRLLVLWGIATMLVGLGLSVVVAMLQNHGQASEWWLLGTLALASIGQALIITPNQTLTLAEVPLRYAGSAGGVLQTGQRVGTAMGIALISSIAFSFAARQGWSVGMSIGFGFIALFLLAAALVGVIDLALGRRQARGRQRS